MITIAIDGPSGAGKSTLARALAKECDYRYVDTGAIYRTVALGLVRGGISLDGVEESHLSGLAIQIKYREDGLQQMLLQGEDVSEAIRANEISKLTSQVAALPVVRDYLLEVQRETARQYSVVMDGRDIATVVFPNADVKIFLTASPEERAKRRVKELEQRGDTQDFQVILQEIVERDQQDVNRPIAPLRQAEDAVLLDTTTLDFSQSLTKLGEIVRKGLEK